MHRSIDVLPSNLNLPCNFFGDYPPCIWIVEEKLSHKVPVLFSFPRFNNNLLAQKGRVELLWLRLLFVVLVF